MAWRLLLLISLCLGGAGCGVLTSTVAAGSCEEHADCPLGEQCQAGRCVVDEGAGPAEDECTVASEASDCGAGQWCDGGECQALPGCVSGACPGGLHCWSDAQCRREEPPPCETDADCAEEGFCAGEKLCDLGTNLCTPDMDPCAPSGLVCDEEADTCRDCLVDEDCPDDGDWCNGDERCVDYKCESVPRGCADPTPNCDPVSEACVECVDGTDCPDDDSICNGAPRCVFNECREGSSPCSGETPVCVEGDALDDLDGGVPPDAGPLGGADGGVPPYLCLTCQDDSDCDDGLHCTGTETCAGGECISSGDPCEASGQACLEGSDSCGDCTGDEDCDDGDWCTGVETCVDGDCVVQNADPCEGLDETPYCDSENEVCRACLEDDHCLDGDNCTEDVCTDDYTCESTEYCPDPQFSYCFVTFFGVGCYPCDIRNGDDDCVEEEDGLFCTGPSVCLSASRFSYVGVCEEDGDPCGGSTPVCDEQEDCCKECGVDNDCDDEEFCNGQETCVGGNGDPCNASCQAGTDPCLGMPVRYRCNEQQDRCDECLNDGHCSDPTPACRSDGTCVECTQAGDCGDGLACTLHGCSGSSCVDLGSPCDDVAGHSSCEEAGGGNYTCACSTSEDCAADLAGTPHCDPSGQCVECLQKSDCGPTEQCTDGICVLEPPPPDAGSSDGG